MWAHSHLIRVEGGGYSQIIRAENADVCRSYGLCLQAASDSNRIDFVVNEAIAEDMYPEIDEKMKPLVHVCCETLLRYRHLSVSNTIMDGNFLVTGEF